MASTRVDAATRGLTRVAYATVPGPRRAAAAAGGHRLRILCMCASRAPRSPLADASEHLCVAQAASLNACMLSSCSGPAIDVIPRRRRESELDTSRSLVEHPRAHDINELSTDVLRGHGRFFLVMGGGPRSIDLVLVQDAASHANGRVDELTVAHAGRPERILARRDLPPLMDRDLGLGEPLYGPALLGHELLDLLGDRVVHLHSQAQARLARDQVVPAWISGPAWSSPLVERHAALDAERHPRPIHALERALALGMVLGAEVARELHARRGLLHARAALSITRRSCSWKRSLSPVSPPQPSRPSAATRDIGSWSTAHRGMRAA